MTEQPPAGAPEPQPPGVPRTPAASAGARLVATWNGLGRRDRLVLVGAIAVLVGALMMAISGGVGANGDGGIALVVALGAIAVVALRGAAIVRPGTRDAAETVLPGLALGLVAVTALDLVQPVRYSADLEVFGGPLGLAGRLVALLGAAVILAGTPPRRLGSPSLAGRLVVGGLLAMVAGWLLLLVLAEGFAMRSIESVGLFAVAVAATAPAPSGALRRGSGSIGVLARDIVRPIAALTGTLVVFEGVLSVVGELGPLAGAPAGVVGLVLYLAGGLLLAAAAFLDLRPLAASLRPSEPRSPSAPDAPTSSSA
jgi:hypothetical protein